jgi:hypothetical protein
MRSWPLAARALLLAVVGAFGCHSASSTHAAGTGAAGAGGSGAGAAGAGGADGGSVFGTVGFGAGDVAEAPCTGVVDPMGPVTPMPWPNLPNIGHDGAEGSSLHFTWTGGSHNVVQIASWQDYWHPSPSFANPNFPRGFVSGPKAASGDVYLNFGSFGCGYRPGIYFFVDEDDAATGIVSAAMTVTPDPSTNTAAYYAPQPCSALASPTVYGGRYAGYASRPGCTVFEVNNFQTEAHYDWLPDTFHMQGAKQGDVILFRWTGFHNVVQVHDVLQDLPVAGGIASGPKSECVGGPNYSCANGPPVMGEYMIDTQDYRPGILHFSDENAIKNPTTSTCWNPGCTGMNQEFMLGYVRPTTPTKCCDLPGASGKYSTTCKVVEVYNDGAGAQWNPYQTPAGGNDVVRFRWAGSIELFQVLPVAGSTTRKPGGVGMSSPVECVPGPAMGCLNGTAAEAEFLFDVGANLQAGTFDTDASGNKTWSFYAVGEVTAGFTSNDSGAIVYPTSAYDATTPKCP